ncbi:MAG TPA: type II toxin-antitoxin system RelE/ParE family toxin [Thermoanaerobaculia bacterium]|nr:type II toxin-antitoxin system RelE/ParE family toxin [Thermoanaerobaculia bacterium]
MTFRIEYAPATVAHLKALTARQQSIVLDGVVRYLSVDPMVETRNRKPRRPNPLAPWELRLGKLRVYFDIVSEPEPVVVVLAVGVNERNTVRFGKTVTTL